MTWPLVASARGRDSVTLNSTGANFLVAAIQGVVPNVTGWDSRGNTWTLLTTSIVGGHRCTIAYCIAPTSVGAGHTLTDPNAGIQDGEFQFYAFTAPGTVSFHSENGANDATFGGTSTKSASYAGSMSVTPPSNDALIFAAVTTLPGGATPTSGYGVDSGFTLGHSSGTDSAFYGGASAYLNQAVAAAVDPTISWTTSARWASASAAFTTSGGGTNQALAGTATASATAAGDLTVSSGGTLTFPTLKNNAGTVLANETGATVHVYALAGGLVVTKTGQTTNASGVMAVTDAAIVPGTTYRAIIVLASAAEGLAKLAAA